jgi:peptidoglycan/LPS O-acetylase OafA/YrhL
VEEQFYLTFPAILKFTPRTSRRRVFLTIFCLLGIWNYFAAIFAWNDFTNPAARAGFACISFGVLVALYESEARTLARRLPALFLAVILLTLLWHPADYFSWLSAL